MPNAMEDVTKEALNLPLHQRLALAGFLLESAEKGTDPEADTAWDTEIRDRILAIDDGRVVGVPLAQQIKADADYNQSIGEALGIVGPKQAGPDYATLKAVINGTAVDLD